MAEQTSKIWLTRTDLRARGWSKAMCRRLLPEPEDTIGPPQHLMEVWSLETIGAIEEIDYVQVWLRNNIQLRAENLSRQLPACQCGLLSQVGQAMVRHLAFELALIAADGDRLMALQAMVTKDLQLTNPASVGIALFDLAHGH